LGADRGGGAGGSGNPSVALQARQVGPAVAADGLAELQSASPGTPREIRRTLTRRTRSPIRCASGSVVDRARSPAMRGRMWSRRRRHGRRGEGGGVHRAV
jgi:hypothetical protein